MEWYAKTRFYHIVDLTTWQLHPSPELLNRVEKQYRPTMLQLQNQHPAIIDWIPFPALRDRLIRLHSANPLIDQIFCDVVSSYVVEACMADLVLDAPATRVYVRVTDVAISAAGTENKDIDPATILPAPDVSSLFLVADCAQAVFKLLNMNHGVSHYKLDPSFFGTYPELFDPENDIVAQGFPLRPNNQTILPSPSRLNDLTFQIYRSFLEFHTLAPL
jgi:threonine aldolase